VRCKEGACPWLGELRDVLPLLSGAQALLWFLNENAPAMQPSAAKKSRVDGRGDAAQVVDEERQRLAESLPAACISLGASSIRLLALGAGPDASWHAPLFSHQAWAPDGRALGYANVRLEVRYSGSLRALATCTWDESPSVAFKDPLGDPLGRLLASPVAKAGLNGFTTSAHEFEAWCEQDAMDDDLPGVVVWQNGQHVIRWCENASLVRDLLARLQSMAFWLIENASHVEPDANFMLAYSSRAHVLTGFVLVYNFATLRKASPATWRICQLAVTLPSQGNGLGRGRCRARANASLARSPSRALCSLAGDGA
jgi:hypothetical protein